MLASHTCVNNVPTEILQRHMPLLREMVFFVPPTPLFFVIFFLDLVGELLDAF